MNIKTVALTREQYQAIIQTMKQGFTGCRPNERVATALVLEANLGLRISDIIHLRLVDSGKHYLPLDGTCRAEALEACLRLPWLSGHQHT
mgnify:CR=1 FL=1